MYSHHKTELAYFEILPRGIFKDFQKGTTKRPRGGLTSFMWVLGIAEARKVLSTKIHLNLNVRMQNANLVKYLADSDKWPSPSFFQARVPSFYRIR